MNQFNTILERLTAWGSQEEHLLAAFVVGSQARSDHPADHFSDLDLVFIADHPEHYLQDNKWLKQLGTFHIAFTENTISGGMEKRVLFDGGLDIDFNFYPSDILDGRLLNNPEILTVLQRGYRILVDKVGLTQTLEKISFYPQTAPFLSESEFTNLANDFWYHAVWSAKKLIRGELWTAKSCVDSYMKQKLLLLIKCHAQTLHGLNYDTWHNGRFLDEWAEDWIVQKLSSCFAHYNREDVKAALLATMELFRSIALEISEQLSYRYPADADRYASNWIKSHL